MQLPGIITLSPNDHDLMKEMADIAGTSFLEENWYAIWLQAIEKLGATDKRKEELLQAIFLDEFTAFAPFSGVYVLEDHTAVTGAYLYSELRGKTLTEIEESYLENFLHLATPEEMVELGKMEEAMNPISEFDWAREYDTNEDHINFYAWAVDPEARGKHSLTRLVTPFFTEADKRGINCYLECYSDHLQAIYEHLGFELLDELRDENFDIYERRMIRRPKLVTNTVE